MKGTMAVRARKEPVVLLAVGIASLIYSGLSPHDRLTWFLEVVPVIIGVPILVLTARRFPLTVLVYRLLFLHALVLMVGGHYTYARVPAGDWFRDLLNLSRNHYDRLGHLAQGFVPAVLTREILLRASPLRRGKWLAFLVVCVCLAFSAFYELVEWWIALAGTEAANDFLGSQGDFWDSQWDMFFALIGAVVALLTLSRTHDRQLNRLGVGDR